MAKCLHRTEVDHFQKSSFHVAHWLRPAVERSSSWREIDYRAECRIQKFNIYFQAYTKHRKYIVTDFHRKYKSQLFERLTNITLNLNCISAGSNIHGFLLSAGCSGSEEPTTPDNFKSKTESWLKIRSSFYSTAEYGIQWNLSKAVILGNKIFVRFRQVIFIRLLPVNWYFGAKSFVRFRQVSALEHVRFSSISIFRNFKQYTLQPV